MRTLTMRDVLRWAAKNDHATTTAEADSANSQESILVAGVGFLTCGRRRRQCEPATPQSYLHGRKQRNANEAIRLQ